MNKEVAKPSHPVAEVKDAMKPHCSIPKTIPPQGLKVEDCEEVNMEATITSQDVMRAGGFGARDDISSFLPVASDSTDFEASILDARDYEEPQGGICRPGLGWKDTKETK